MVEAVVVKSDPGSTGTNIVLEIKRAFGSAGALVGTKFDAEVLAAGGLGALVLEPPPRVDEIGIWQVTGSDGAVVPDVVGMQSYAGLVEMPARKLGSADDRAYREALEWAEAVTRAKEAPATERTRTLEAYARGHEPIVAAWAVQTLGQDPTPETVEFLLELAEREGVPVLAQIALDEALCRVASDTWKSAPERLQMLSAWVSGGRTEVVAARALVRLDVAVQRGDLAPTEGFELFRTAVLNPELPASARASACVLLGKAMRDEATSADAFALLARIAGTGEPESVRIAAARAIRSFVELDEQRRRTIEELIARDGQGEIATILRPVLERER